MVAKSICFGAGDAGVEGLPDDFLPDCDVLPEEDFDEEWTRSAREACTPPREAPHDDTIIMTANAMTGPKNVFRSFISERLVYFEPDTAGFQCKNRQFSLQFIILLKACPIIYVNADVAYLGGILEAA